MISWRTALRHSRHLIVDDSWIKLVKTATRELQSFLFPLVPREAREFNTCVFCFLSSRGPFQPMKRCENCLIPRGRFQVEGKKTNCQACVKRRRFFILKFKDFFLPGSTMRIRNIGKWSFSQFKFDLLVFSPLFAYPNKLDRSHSITLWRSFLSVIKSKVVFTFICLKICSFLFADTYSLQSQANCIALTSTTSAKSQNVKQIKQTLTWGFGSLKLLHENTVFAIVA